MAAKKARTPDAGVRAGADSHPAVEWLWEWMGRLFLDRFGRMPLRKDEDAAIVLKMLRDTTPVEATRKQRAAGWNLWINAVTGYVRSRESCPRRFDLTSIAQDKGAFAAGGAEVRRRLIAGESPLPINGSARWPIPRSGDESTLASILGTHDHPLHDLPKNLWTLPDPWAPYQGEHRELVSPPTLIGWEQIRPAVAKRMDRLKVSERTARAWCKKHGVAVHDDRGRKWVDQADLERAGKLPASRK